MADKKTKTYQTCNDMTNYLTQQQIDRMYKLCRNAQEQVLIRMMQYTGRRVTEILLTKIKNVDFDNCEIIFPILKKKHYKEKRIPVPEKLINLLTLYIDQIPDHELSPERYLFESKSRYVRDKKGNIERRNHISRQRVFQIVRRLSGEASIPYSDPGWKNTEKEGKVIQQNRIFHMKKGWHPHHFRHSFSINFLKRSDNNNAIVILKDILDHSNVNITEAYLQFHNKDIKEQIDKVFQEEQ